MDRITLICNDEFNEPKTFEFYKEATSISLMHENLLSIDLSPLSFCNNLETLSLGFNQFRIIDLNPIGSCRTLSALSLVRNSLQEIDLKPLESCTNLEILDLSLCELERIDLTPLRSCKNLSVLDLRQNQLQNVDLSPLSSCNHLNNINLSANQLQSVNLDPLEACHNLKGIILGFNRLRELDLGPLRRCANLWLLELNHNHLENINLSPLAECSRLSRLCLHDNPLHAVDITFLIFMNQRVWELESVKNASLQTFLTEDTIRLQYDHFIPPSVEYNVPTKLKDLQIISRLVQIVRNLEPSWKRVLLTQSILSELNLDWLGILDNDIDMILDMLVNSEDFADFKEEAVHLIFTQFREQIKGHGTTIGMSIEKLSISRDFASSVEKVLELRQRELRYARVVSNGDEIDLTPLWLTAYGYEILGAMHLGLKTDAIGLQQVEGELRKLDVDLCYDEENRNQMSTVFSDDLKNYILWIVQSRDPSASKN